jgi:hypothetical protein
MIKYLLGNIYLKLLNKMALWVKRHISHIYFVFPFLSLTQIRG